MISSHIFLLWLYNSLCRVLAFPTNYFHLLLSWTRVFQFSAFNFCISFLILSSQRIFGLPIGLLEMGFQEYIALTILVALILSMRPSHPSLYSIEVYYVLVFYYFIQFLVGSYSPNAIFLKAFLSKTISLLVMVSFSVHVSHAYVTTGPITEQYNFNFAILDISLL